MNIYTSEKAMPYVYMGTHRVTGEFYIGSRANKKQTLPSHQDIYKYRTSSKKVKPIFDEFDWIIVAEFFDPQSAYDFEQELIHEYWNSPLKLNQTCHYNKPKFSTAGHKWSQQSRDMLSKTKAGKAPRGGIITDETKHKLAAARAGKHHSDEVKAKISNANKGRVKATTTLEKLITARNKNNTITWTLISPDGVAYTTTMLRQQLLTLGFSHNNYKTMHSLHTQGRTIVSHGVMKGWQLLH